MPKRNPVKIFLFLSCLAASPLLAETIELSPVKDNTLFEDAEGRFSNGGGKHVFMGRVEFNFEELLRRTLVAFDLSDIPKNAVVNNVQLEFEIVRAPPEEFAAADSATLHLLESDWGEGFADAPGVEGQGTPADAGAATWIHRFFDPDPSSAIFWETPGGDFQSQPSASALFNLHFPETLTFSSTPELVADVKNWVAHPETNFGWMVRGDESRLRNARAMASREHVDQPVPKLIIDYTIPSVTDFLALTELTTSLTNPVSVAHAGDNSGRLFIVEQEGIIRIYDTVTNTLLPAPFLDIQNEVFSMQDTGGGNEQGLLGLAFHPDYFNNGRFFVNYTTSPANGVWRTVVAEYGVSLNDDLALESGEVLLEFEQEARNHNGGDIHFGPDGYLYIASGDGGGGNDQYDNAQDIDTLRGALLRIDVDTLAPEGSELCGLVSAYGIPPGNAFPGANDGCDEILHIGLRNPWRFSFDAQTGDLLIADVGQGEWEEINHVPATASGLNFGWPCREGMHEFNPGKTCTPPLTEPVLEYAHVDGNCSVTGGYVYHGNKLPLNGRYLYGDWCSERVWIGSNAGGTWSAEEWQGTAAVLQSLSSFGQDENCELYITDRDGGALYRIDDGEIVFRNSLESSKCQ